MSQIGRVFTNSGPGGFIQTLTGNDGVAVGPTAGNINVVGAGNITVTGNAGTSTETITIVGTTNHAVQVGNAAGSLTSIPVGTTNTALLGNTGADPSFGQVPNAALVNSTITLVNGNNINITGSPVALGAAATINVAGTTNHTLQIGNAFGSLTSLGVATNGQLPIGSTGADPVLATLTAGTGITITNGAGSITIAASGSTTLTYTNVNHAASPYTVLATDEYISVDCSAGVVSLLFPNAATTGREYIIKDRTGNANINNISVTSVGGAINFDGVTTYTMNTQYSAINIIGNSTSYEIF
jgi:hypothetical protein